MQENQEIRTMNKTTCPLFRNQKAVPVGVCHDVRNLSYDNHLIEDTFALSKFHFSHNTILSLHNIL